MGLRGRQQRSGETVVIARTEGNLIAAIVDGGPDDIEETQELMKQAGWECVTVCMALTPDMLRTMARAGQR